MARNLLPYPQAPQYTTCTTEGIIRAKRLVVMMRVFLLEENSVVFFMCVLDPSPSLLDGGEKEGPLRAPRVPDEKTCTHTRAHILNTSRVMIQNKQSSMTKCYTLKYYYYYYDDFDAVHPSGNRHRRVLTRKLCSRVTSAS